MKKAMTAGLSVAAIATTAFALNTSILDSNPNYVKLKNFHPKGVSNQQCLLCHKTLDPGIVADWEHSKHAKYGVGCVQCHVVPKNYPTAFKTHPYQGPNWTVQIAVSSVTCAKCHAKEVIQFLNSGHARAGAQWLAVNGSKHGYLMTKLAYYYEALKGKNPSLNGVSGAKMAKGIRKDGSVFYANQNDPRIADLTAANACVQCHGTVIKLNKNGVPNPATWPNDGMASLYPDGGVGNCLACHTRHTFSASEARQPASCATCHLGPDHPDIEIYDSSVHGHIFETDKQFYNFHTGAQIPDKTLRAPTCFTCHMSGINGLHATHNVSLRLKWNLWAPTSFLRTGGHETAGWAWWKHGGKVIPGVSIIRGNPRAGNPAGPEAARAQMKQVCATCHEATFINNYFQRVDAAVKTYNEYYAWANKMMKNLRAKGLIMHDAWSDPFFRLWFYLWHHEGRRFRQGAAMGSPDFAHWHGVFEVMQDIREMTNIYNYRMRMYKKYGGNAQKVLENEPPMPDSPHN